METDRIVLRSWLDTDAEILYKYASDPDVGPRAGWPPYKSVEESLDVIRNVFNRDTNTWAIVLKETGQVIGSPSRVGILQSHDAPYPIAPIT